MAQLVATPDTEITWHLEWTAEESANSSALGVLTISIGAEDVWTSDDGDWPWLDLLRWLTNSWPWLRGEEGPPELLDSDARSLRSLRASSEVSAPHTTNASFSRASLALWEFRETHDLSRALAGASAPAIVIWREGLNAHVLTDSGRYLTSWRHVEQVLSEVGEKIAQRLMRQDSSSLLIKQLTRAWRNRDETPSGRWLSIARGQGQENVVPLPVKWDSIQLGEVETSPVMAAARMTSRLSAPLADKILTLIYQIPRAESSIDDVSSAVMSRVDLTQSDFPFEQAYMLATAFRSQLGLDPETPLDPEKWLEDIGVLVRDVRLGIKGIEAFAAWGPDNGPGILVNVDGMASSSRSGRNASLAHELCHLIVDRMSALPAAEVLGGRVDTRVEQRARAFAAEILLPRAAAESRFADVVDATGGQRAVNSLRSRFKVSGEVVAWQTRNSDASLNAEVFEYLRGLVSQPERF